MAIKFFIIFFAALAIDGLVLPALFNFRNSSLALLAVLLGVLYLGPQRQTIILGLSFSIVSEAFRGLNLGTLAIPFLFTAVIMYSVQKFLDIKYTHKTRFSLSRSFILASFSTVFVYVFLTFYKLGGANPGYFDPLIGLTIISEALFLIFIFSAVFNKKSDYASRCRS